MGHPKPARLGQIGPVLRRQGGGVHLPAQQGQALAALEQSAPLHPAGQAVGARLLHRQQKGAVVQGELVPGPGGLHHAPGDGDAPGAQQGGTSLPEGNRFLQPSHPQLRALEVHDQAGLHPRLPGGGPELLLQQGGALREGGVGQVQPGPGHPRLKHGRQNLPPGAGGAQRSV